MNKQLMAADDRKLVILVRNDLNMSPGKACAQVGHASMLFLADVINTAALRAEEIKLKPVEWRWIFDNGPISQQAGQSIAYGGMKKIVLGVQDLDDLWVLHWAAKDAGIKVFNVFDEGVNDITACAIGPDYASKIDDITGELNLYGPPPVTKEEPQELDFIIRGVGVEKMLIAAFDAFMIGREQAKYDGMMAVTKGSCIYPYHY